MRQLIFKGLIFFIVIIFISILINTVLSQSKIHLSSPFSPSSGGDTPPLSSLSEKTYVVYGFAPYWNLQKTVIQPELTHLAYFSLPITIDGELDGVTTKNGGTSKVRWESERVETAVRQLGPDQTLTIVLTQFDNHAIETFLSTPSAQTRFQNSLITLLETSPKPIEGFNLDMESSGNTRPEIRQKYTEFVERTRQALDTYAKEKNRQPLQLSVSVYPGAAKKGWLWDVPAIAPFVDHFVVMAYDFHKTSSPVAGPVAPVFGGKKNWDTDIVAHLKEFLEVVPPEKILLGIPFYGYEWQTTSSDARSFVFPGTGSSISYSQVQKLLEQSEELGIQQGWDEDALSPYLIFSKNGRTHVIYYENSRSLGYKLDLVTGLRLGGIAIWALGYEDESREPWDMIGEKLDR